LSISTDPVIEAVVVEEHHEAERVIEFSEPINPYLEKLGETPLPPYINTPLDDPNRYQTIFARHEGSAAAPTAGLHFTGEMLIQLKNQGIQIAYCTLHIGLDTFAPVREDNVSEHRMHTERAILTPENATIINNAKLQGHRIVAIGTTAVRTLETAAIRSAAYGTEVNDHASIQNTLKSVADNVCPWRPVIAISEDTDLFITPGYRFRAVDVILTNFHLPKSTLLMLVSAFAGREHMLHAYEEAIRLEYRFYSLGDCCLLL
jgi:S-adenosylmethionine:tRNA ribosyltransferase-isomerase